MFHIGASQDQTTGSKQSSSERSERSVRFEPNLRSERVRCFRTSNERASTETLNNLMNCTLNYQPFNFTLNANRAKLNDKVALTGYMGTRA